MATGRNGGLFTSQQIEGAANFFTRGAFRSENKKSNSNPIRARCLPSDWTGMFGSRESDLGRVIDGLSIAMKFRWSFGERRTKKGYLTMFWSWIFFDTLVNFDVYHRLIRRRLGVDSSFTSGVCVRTTTTCTPSAMTRTSRRTVVVEGHGRRHTTLFVSNKVTNDDRTVA